MAYPYFNPYYPQPMPDNLMQMRQMQQPQMQPMQQPMAQPVQQNPIAQGGVQWVSGEQEARGYLIAPNSAVALWDSTAPTVYLKQADASGKPTLRSISAIEVPLDFARESILLTIFSLSDIIKKSHE